MNLNERNPNWGLYSHDGTVIPLSALTAASIEYVNYSITQLENMLQENIVTEQYEKCAGIRDELSRRGM
ncbi:hypothetical protein EOD41_00340 [Mucilaginibacter limnophilus]|uniref:Uncharacterized protein n=1 Tax=Mucilaginibacter limnophilus TaxID=1932778 RepID=A0A437MXQ5_9SPHI|nr:hypothetical protein [Mucilaginibacter limnophilus]RVU02423.1 hypothetical protein EOD41_00340 [Mucilaginibacter limnophilus]